MKELNRSETRTIKRSQINLNPYNIKNHTDEQIKLQVKNIRNVGLLGGMLWNETTGNLVDGHKRLMSADYIQKYDGTPETDYDIKVEVVNMDEKQEKNQLSFMALANSKADYNLVANIIDDIDYKDVGISEEEYNQILDLRDYETDEDILGDIETIEDVFAPKPKKKDETPYLPEEYDAPQTNNAITEDTEEQPQSVVPTAVPTAQPSEQSTPSFIKDVPQQTAIQKPTYELGIKEETNEEFLARLDAQPHMTKEEVKAQKEHVKNEGNKLLSDADRYIVVDFRSQEDKEMFCEILGITYHSNMVIDSHVIMSALVGEE